MNAKAFPSSCSEPINKGKFGVIGVRETYHAGMSLRDYFAAKAMQSLLTNPEILTMGIGRIANQAYRIADAMIEAGKL
jgi:hypothetical protein